MWRLSSYSSFALSPSPGDFGKVSQCLCAPLYGKQGYLCSGRCLNSSKHNSSIKWDTHNGNLDFVHSSGLVSHWSIPLAMNLLKSQMLSDLIQPQSSVLPLLCSCAIAFPSQRAPSGRETLGGFVQTFPYV